MEANSTNNNSATEAQQEENVVILYNGDTANLDDCVMLSEDYYERDFESLYALREDCTMVSIGGYGGDWILEEHAIHCIGGKVATEADQEVGEVHATHCGDTFHEEQAERYDIVYTEDGEYAYDFNCSYVWISSSRQGYVITDWNSDIVVAENGEEFMNERIAELNGYHYSRSSGTWVEGEEEDDNSNGVRDYHHYTRRRRYDNDNDVPKFCFGMEVEKEDGEVRNEKDADDIYNSLEWCKERDGSLNDATGFEAVSPVYDLFGKRWKEDLKNQDLQRILNAKYSDSCGGHFNLSSSEFSASELAEGLSAFFPLLYAIYPNRMNGNYCSAKKKNEMLYRGEKRSAIYVHSGRVEFRIFPAVKNVDNYKWRINLMKIFVAHINKSEVDVLMMLLNKKSALRKHLELAIPAEKIDSKIMLFVQYSKLYNDKNIDNNFNSAKK